MHVALAGRGDVRAGDSGWEGAGRQRRRSWGRWGGGRVAVHRSPVELLHRVRTGARELVEERCRVQDGDGWRAYCCTRRAR
jgi:hypothetical protein